MRGYHHLSCPHCGTVNQDIYVDLEMGRSGAVCTGCGEWFGVRRQIVTYDPATLRGSESPLWEAAIKLLSWVPEWKTPEYFAKQDVEQWSMAYHTEQQKADFLQDAEGTEDAPFVSETYLYHCLGKDDGRTLLALLRHLLEAGGISMYETEVEAVRRKREEDTDD